MILSGTLEAILRSFIPQFIAGFALLAGCQYGPLEHEENQPALADAVIERDITVLGQSVLRYFENDNGNFGDFLCTIEQEVEGWAADELNDETCIGCGATYTLGLRTVESDCDFGAGGTADIALVPLAFFSQNSTDSSFADWLEANDADAFLNTTWYPRGPTPWTPRMGAFYGESPDDPFADGPWDCGEDLCAESRYWYGTADWYGKWWLALDLPE